MINPTTIGDRAESEMGARIYGRESEWALLDEIAATDGPSIVYLYGPHGIGKTALLAAVSASLAARGVSIGKIRGIAVEPQPAAFITAVGTALQANARSSDELCRVLARRDGPIVLIIDDVDELRLIATWIRREFARTLPVNVRLILAGRSAPPAAWLAEFGVLFRPIELRALKRDTVIEKCLADGLNAKTADQLWKASAGHPLLLSLLRQSARDQAPNGIRPTAQLVSDILSDFSDLGLIRVTEGAAVVRRATRPLLAAMLDVKSMRSFETFCGLPFVRLDREGYFIAEIIRRPLAEQLESVEPNKYASLRATAANWIYGRLQSAGPSTRWRFMADLLYLVDQPQVRDAFFPPETEVPSVEPAEMHDFAAIRKIVGHAAGAQEQMMIDAWIRHLPHRFNVVRGADGSVLAFYVFARGDDPIEELAVTDPLLSYWRDHVSRTGRGGEVIFLRQLLSSSNRDDAPERAACLLDLKRAYFERWNLSRVYSIASTGAIANPAYRRLGFRPLQGPGGLPGSMILELSGGGLIGWVKKLVATEVAPVIKPGFDFMRDRREVRVEGRACRLTRLEAEVLAMLIDHAPAVVSREAMLAAIWKRAHVGSNVVDTVVRSLRKKLGTAGQTIGTVPKSGYRLYVE